MCEGHKGSLTQGSEGGAKVEAPSPNSQQNGHHLSQMSWKYMNCGVYREGGGETGVVKKCRPPLECWAAFRHPLFKILNPTGGA